MKRSDLEKLGLTEEQITEVMKLKSTSIEELETQVETLSKEKKTLETENADLKNNVAQRDEDIKALKNSKDNVSKETYEALEEKYKELETTSKKNVEDVTKNFLIDKVLSNSKAKNLDVLKKQLDLEKVTLENNEIKGLDEQIKALQESDSYLFNIEDPEQNQTELNLGGDHNGSTPSNDFSFDFAGVREKPKQN